LILHEASQRFALADFGWAEKMFGSKKKPEARKMPVIAQTPKNPLHALCATCSPETACEGRGWAAKVVDFRNCISKQVNDTAKEAVSQQPRRTAAGQPLPPW